jgi:hypothetical protein
MQNGIPEYNTLTTYYIGSIVSDGVGGIYVSLVDDSLNQSLTNGDKWLNFYTKKVTVIATSANYVVQNADWYIRWTDTATSTERYIDLPTPSAENKGREIIVKYTGGTFISLLVVRVTGGSTIDGAASVSLGTHNAKRFVSNGTNWEVI